MFTRLNYSDEYKSNINHVGKQQLYCLSTRFMLLLVLSLLWITDAANAELPPPYVPTGASGAASISCKVCQAVINLEGKASQLVVKCNSCNEATVSFLAVICFVVLMLNAIFCEIIFLFVAYHTAWLIFHQS